MESSWLKRSLVHHGLPLLNALKADSELYRSLEIEKTSKEVHLENHHSTEASTDSFHTLLCEFIAKKADLLFDKRLRDPSKWTGNEAEEMLMPPLECFLNLPGETLRHHFLQSIQAGDVIIAEVFASNPDGLVLRVLFSEHPRRRDLTHSVPVEAFCPLEEVPRLPGYRSAVEMFQPGDRIRAFVVATTVPLQVSLKSETVPSTHRQAVEGKTKLGLVPSSYRPFRNAQRNYSALLRRSRTFSDPASLAPQKKTSYASLFREMFLANPSPDEMVEAIRRQQSTAWSHQLVEQGVSFFKKGQTKEALERISSALRIDVECVEALVARGAILANQTQFEKACGDLEKAVELKPTHRNARKYLVQVLIALARSESASNRLDAAMGRLERVLELEPDNEEAARALQRMDPARIVDGGSSSPSSERKRRGSEDNGHQSPAKKTVASEEEPTAHESNNSTLHETPAKEPPSTESLADLEAFYQSLKAKRRSSSETKS